MLINTVLKGLLGVSVVTALAATFPAQAQTSGSTSGQSTSGAAGTAGHAAAGADKYNTPQRAGTSGSAGSTSRPGDVSGQSGASGTSGATGAAGATGTAATTTPSGASGTSATSATTSGSGKVAKADQKIVMDMAQGNMAEIDMAKLAQSKSQNDQVKTYAQQMIDDHTKALSEVQQLAQTKGITLPTDIDAAHKAAAAKLSALNGDAFDRAYMKQGGLADHKKMHSMLTSAQAKAKDPDVKALVTKITPTVDQHLNAAQQMNTAKGSSKTKGNTATGSGQ
jgi:putative membrane protein